MKGSLAVSVMSLKGYQTDSAEPGSFYIRAVRNDDVVVSTEAKSPRSPHEGVMFMEQLVIPYHNAKRDILKLELLQSADGGDLVLGECKMRIRDVVAAGTVHSWFPFIDAADPEVKAAELLMAIRARCGMAEDAPKSKNKLPVMAKSAAPTRTGTRASNLPVPIVLGAAVILAVLSFAKTKRPIYYTVEEGDNLCTIGECFNQDYRMMYDRNRNVISDPHVIYPGDRIRIA